MKNKFSINKNQNIDFWFNGTGNLKRDKKELKALLKADVNIKNELNIGYLAIVPDIRQINNQMFIKAKTGYPYAINQIKFLQRCGITFNTTLEKTYYLNILNILEEIHTLMNSDQHCKFIDHYQSKVEYSIYKYGDPYQLYFRITWKINNKTTFSIYKNAGTYDFYAKIWYSRFMLLPIGNISLLEVFNLMLKKIEEITTFPKKSYREYIKSYKTLRENSPEFVQYLANLA